MTEGQGKRAIAAKWLPPLAFLAMVLAFYWRFWTPISGARRTFSWDAIWEYWGDLQFQIDAYRNGHLPLWNPFDRTGYPFHADPQAGVLYPINWLLVGLGLAAGAGYWLVGIKVLLHFWLSGLGMYAFLRRRGLPIAACYAGGALMLLTYPTTHHTFSALNWGMAWAPWMLLTIDVWAERPSVAHGAAVAIALGMGQLAGAPGAFWYSLLAAVPYGVWALVHHLRAAPDRRSYAREAARSVGVAAALFFALVGAQLGATAALVKHTVRDQRDLDFVGTTAFGADDYVGMLVPGMPGEGCYLGILAVFCMGAALALRPTARTLVVAGVASLGVLCAFGNLGPFLPAAASAAPPFGFFRRAHRYLHTTMVAVAILGAEGLTALLAVTGQRLRRRAALAVLGAGAVLAIVFGTSFVTRGANKESLEVRDAYMFAFVSTIVSAGVLVLVIASRGRRRRVFAGVAALVLGLDLWIARAPAIERGFWPVPVARHDAEVARLEGVPLEARIYDRAYLGYRPGIRLGIRDLGGYEGDPLALRRYASFLAAATAAPRVFGHANVRWVLEGNDRTVPRKLPVDKDALRPVRSGVFEVAAVAPAVVWHDRAQVVADEEAALTSLKGGRPGTVAILEQSTLSPEQATRAVDGDPAAAPVAGTITSLGLRELTAEIDAPADGVVVLNEAYYPGWTATVDGAPAEIVPANLVFRGVFVGAGHHVIELRYHATRYLALAPLSLLGWLVALALVLRGRRATLRARQPTP